MSEKVGKAVLELSKAGAELIVPGASTALKLGGIGAAIFGSPDGRLQECVKDEIEKAVFQEVPDINRRVQALEKRGTNVSSADLLKLLQDFARTYASAQDARKREIAKRALYQSFDPELYESSMLSHLWTLLDELLWGDIWLLAQLTRTRDLPLGGVDSFRRFHLDNLKSAGLVIGNTRLTVTRVGKMLLRLAQDPDGEGLGEYPEMGLE